MERQPKHRRPTGDRSTAIADPVRAVKRPKKKAAVPDTGFVQSFPEPEARDLKWSPKHSQAASEWKAGQVYLAQGKHLLSGNHPFAIVSFAEAALSFQRALRSVHNERDILDLDSLPENWVELNKQLGTTLVELSRMTVQSGEPALRPQFLAGAIKAFSNELLDWKLRQDRSKRLALGELQDQLDAIDFIEVPLEVPLLRLTQGAVRERFESAPFPVKVGPAISDVETVRDKRIITRNGVRYLPLSLSAAKAQADESTVRKWIANRVKFRGKAIDTYISVTKDIYVGEDSTRCMAERFVAWPSNKPAGVVVLGETDDQSGYLGLTDAARLLKVGHHTMWLWVKQEKAPTGAPLDVIKCTVSDHLYVREKDIAELKEAIPRSGLRRGRRPREAAPS